MARRKSPHHPRLITKHPISDYWPMDEPIMGGLAAAGGHADGPGRLSLSAIGHWIELRPEIEALQAWAAQRCTLAEWRTYQRRPPAHRGRRPPLPTGWREGDRWASEIRRRVDAASCALESGKVDEVHKWLESARS
jgi:hypothetical protein